jgi:hypothetical protein
MPFELMTYVCSDCGVEEAMLQFAGFDLADEKWPVSTDNTRLKRHAHRRAAI